jgi:outer membrane protein
MMLRLFRLKKANGSLTMRSNKTNFRWMQWPVKFWLCLTACLFFFIPQSLRAQDTAPPAPNKPWSPPRLRDYERELSQIGRNNSNAVPTDPEKIYDLPELIDIAERSHPETRVAWEQARAQAEAVGLSKSAYYPYLAAVASEEFAHALTAIDSVFVADAFEENVGIELRWLLLDFGARKATVEEARQKLMAINVNFNATHQKVVYSVTQGFYVYNTSRQAVAAAQSTLEAAQTVANAAQARLDNGLGTTQDALQAKQELAQADYNLAAAQGNENDAQVALMDALGIFPSTQIHVHEIPDQPVPNDSDEPLDNLIDRALSQRTDLVAKLAGLKAGEAAVNKARADYYPKLSLEADAGWSKLDISAFNSPYFGNSKPVYSAGLGIELPIFDGFARRDKLRIAQAQLRAAENDLTDSRDHAVEEVIKGYNDLKTALRKQDAAEVLVSAAQTAFDATLESYRNGLGTYVNVEVAQRNLATARTTAVDARSSVYTSKTTLALKVGDLARPAPAPATTHH